MARESSKLRKGWHTCLSVMLSLSLILSCIPTQAWAEVAEEVDATDQAEQVSPMFDPEEAQSSVTQESAGLDENTEFERDEAGETNPETSSETRPDNSDATSTTYEQGHPQNEEESFEKVWDADPSGDGPETAESTDTPIRLAGAQLQEEAEEKETQYRLVLTWGEEPEDLDSHVEGWRPDGQPMHVYYADSTDYIGDKWYCSLDYDETDGYGPENIYIEETSQYPCYYYVYNYSGNDDGTLASSGAHVELYQGSKLLKTYDVPKTSSEHRYWNVCALINGEIVEANTLTKEADLSYADVPYVAGHERPLLHFNAENAAGKEVDAACSADWDDAWFVEGGEDYLNSYEYHHDLATTMSVLASAAYNSSKDRNNDGLIDRSNDYVGRARRDLRLLGFNEQSIREYVPKTGESNQVVNGSIQATSYNVPTGKLNTGYDRVGYTFAHKTLYNGTHLVAILVRGTAKNEEWYSNFNVDSSIAGLKEKPKDRHEGFSSAAQDLEGSLIEYLRCQFGNEGYANEQYAFIICGHSRGAGVANIVEADLSSSTSVIGELADRNNVYGYNFATPATIWSSEYKMSFDNIYNINNPEDLVTMVPLAEGWNYWRYGTDLVLPSSTNVGRARFNELHAEANDYFKDYAGRDRVPFETGTAIPTAIAASLRKCAGTVGAYYYKKLDGGVSLYQIANPMTTFELSQILAKALQDKPISQSEIDALARTAACFIASYVIRALFDIEDHDTATIAAMARTLCLEGTDALSEQAHDMHHAQSYIAWMKSSQTGDDLFVHNKMTKTTVSIRGKSKNGGKRNASPLTTVQRDEAPLDLMSDLYIDVYDKDGSYVGGFDGDEADGSDIVIERVGSSVQFFTPGDNEYTFKVSSDSAIETDIVTEVQTATGIEVERNVFPELSIGADALIGTLPEQDSSENAATTMLADSDGKSIDAASDTNSTATVHVNVTPEGSGYIDGATETEIGSTLLLSAHTNEDSEDRYRFVCWKNADGDSVCTDPDFMTVVTGNTTYTAVFEKLIPLSEAKIERVDSVTYDFGKSLQTTYAITHEGNELIEGQDFYVRWEEVYSIDEHSIYLKGLGRYFGNLTIDVPFNRRSISNCSVKGIVNATYSGKAIKQNLSVSIGDNQLETGTDYSVSYKNNTNAGTATVTVTGKGNFTDSKKATFKIAKAKNGLSAKAKAKKVKRAKVAKKKQVVKKAITASGADGKVTYKLVKSKKTKKFKVNAKTGAITVPKGTKKGTYKVKVRVTAAGDANHESATKTVTVKIKVK